MYLQVYRTIWDGHPIQEAKLEHRHSPGMVMYGDDRGELFESFMAKLKRVPVPAWIAELGEECRRYF